VEPLLEIFDPNAIGDFDSGGSVPGAPLRALDGAQSIARVLVHSFSEPGFTFAVEDVNGDPGVIVRLHGSIAAVIALGVYNHRVDVIHAVGNPKKLAHLQ
jgi:RNA polymerase sigma-70 factor (ECF subfamily)